jgi:uncharacterized protein YbjQ (UPF0145 family)
MNKAQAQFRRRISPAVLALLLGVILIVGSSCATDVANRYYSSKHYPRRPVAQVELLSKEPSHPYEVIADFQSRNESPEAIREKAADIGADAVIVTTLGGRYSDAEQWTEQKHDRNVYTRIVGTAIKYKQPEAQ